MPSERDYKTFQNEMKDVSGYPFDPYEDAHWPWGRCRWFPWLPRWWWAGIYGSMMPYTTISKEQEKSLLEHQAKLLEQTLEQIKKRLEELKKEE